MLTVQLSSWKYRWNTSQLRASGTWLRIMAFEHDAFGTSISFLLLRIHSYIIVNKGAWKYKVTALYATFIKSLEGVLPKNYNNFQRFSTKQAKKG